MQRLGVGSHACIFTTGMGPTSFSTRVVQNLQMGEDLAPCFFYCPRVPVAAAPSFIVVGTQSLKKNGRAQAVGLGAPFGCLIGLPIGLVTPLSKYGAILLGSVLFVVCRGRETTTACKGSTRIPLTVQPSPLRANIESATHGVIFLGSVLLFAAGRGVKHACSLLNGLNWRPLSRDPNGYRHSSIQASRGLFLRYLAPAEPPARSHPKRRAATRHARFAFRWLRAEIIWSAR